MAWIARDKFENTLVIFDTKPYRGKFADDTWCSDSMSFPLTGKDLDEKLIGRHITWEDDPVEI